MLKEKIVRHFLAFEKSSNGWNFISHSDTRTSLAQVYFQVPHHIIAYFDSLHETEL